MRGARRRAFLGRVIGSDYEAPGGAGAEKCFAFPDSTSLEARETNAFDGTDRRAARVSGILYSLFFIPGFAAARQGSEQRNGVTDGT
jgi:hypothetical protein